MQKSYIHPLILLFFCTFSGLNVHGDSKITEIPFGTEADELGLMKTDFGYVPPFFFSIGVKTLAVADVHKERIARFSFEGEFLNAVDSPLINPRLRSFTNTPENGFILYTDDTLYKIDENAEVLWQYPFPPGSTPDLLLLQGTFCYIHMPGNQNTGHSGVYLFDIGNGTLLGEIKNPKGDASIPGIPYKGRFISLHLKNLAAVAAASSGGQLLSIGPETLIWQEGLANGSRITVTDSAGKILHQKTLLQEQFLPGSCKFIDAGTNGNCFYTRISPEGMQFFTIEF